MTHANYAAHAKISTHGTHAKILWTHATHATLVTHAKILWTHATHTTYAKIWPTPLTHPRYPAHPRNLADSSVELYNILSYSRFFFNNFLPQSFEKSA